MEKTIANLAAAFAGESQARNRYHFYAKAAKKEGFEQIAALFQLTADNEKEHASMLMKLIAELRGQDLPLEAISITAEVPTGVGTTAENLRAAIAGETYEWDEMYPGFADAAQAEGLPRIAAKLRAIARAEAHHAERYERLLEQVEAGTVFKKDAEVQWVCRECGYVHTGTQAPALCPSCDHERAYYELKCETY
jgi:rubrerythrin